MTNSAPLNPDSEDDFIKMGQCILCGKHNALNQGICAAHSAEVAQAYLFGFADGKASAQEGKL